MTSATIKKILENVGIESPMNTWIELPQITSIVLAQDRQIYMAIGEKYYFDEINERIQTSHDNGVTVDSYYSFSTVDGFIRSSMFGPEGSYYRRKI